MGFFDILKIKTTSSHKYDIVYIRDKVTGETKLLDPKRYEVIDAEEFLRQQKEAEDKKVIEMFNPDDEEDENSDEA
jgi:hypothetical protein